MTRGSRLWAITATVGILFGVAVPARSQDAAVTVKGTLYVHGFATKLRCDAADGNKLSRTMRFSAARYLIFGLNCPLRNELPVMSFTGDEQQIMARDPANPTPKDALYFIGSISDPSVNPPYFKGVLQGTLKTATTPISERGIVTYFQDGLGYTSTFVGEYKARY